MSRSQFIIERPSTLAEFFQATTAFFLEHEAVHGLMLSIAALAESGTPPNAFWAFARNANGAPAGAALRTIPKMMLSREAEPGAMAALAEALRNANFKSILGPWPSLESFARAAGGSWSPSHHHVLYECRAVRPPPPAAGHRRLALVADRALVTDWIQAFSAEAIGDGATREAAEALADRRLREKSMWLWCLGDAPVACAGVSGPTPHGIRINAVYTEPSHRRHGYASSLVASLTHELLEGGRDFVFLYADRANPTANAIYQRMGYQSIAEAGELIRSA